MRSERHRAGFPGLSPRRFLASAVLGLISFFSHNFLYSQEAVGTKDADHASLLAVPPRSWAVDAAKNEMIAMHHTGSYLSYQTRIVNDKGEQVREVMESKDGTVARLLGRNGKPLTDEQDKAERQRLNDLVASPAVFFRHVRNNESDRKMADRLIPLMPDAALFSYTPGQPQTGNNHGALEIVLDYKPNPKFNPPNTEAEALTGLQGRVWIDAKSRYIVRMEGTIARPVNFGWGMLAHIYPGGNIELNQTDAGDGRWIFTSFSMRLTVRALMVKTLMVHTEVSASNFRALPPLGYQEAIRRLLETSPPEP